MEAEEKRSQVLTNFIRGAPSENPVTNFFKRFAITYKLLRKQPVVTRKDNTPFQPGKYVTPGNIVRMDTWLKEMYVGARLPKQQHCVPAKE